MGLPSRPNQGRKFDGSNSGGRSLWAGWPGQRAAVAPVVWAAYGSEFSVRTGGGSRAAELPQRGKRLLRTGIAGPIQVAVRREIDRDEMKA